MQRLNNIGHHYIYILLVILVRIVASNTLFRLWQKCCIQTYIERWLHPEPVPELILQSHFNRNSLLPTMCKQRWIRGKHHYPDNLWAKWRMRCKWREVLSWYPRRRLLLPRWNLLQWKKCVNQTSNCSIPCSSTTSSTSSMSSTRLVFILYFEFVCNTHNYLHYFQYRLPTSLLYCWKLQ